MKKINIHKTLALLRKQKNISQDYVCEQTGISKASLSAYENGHTVPTLENVAVLVSFYKISLDYLVFGKETVIPLSSMELTSDQLDRVSFRLESHIERQSRLLAFIGQALEEKIGREVRRVSDEYMEKMSKAGTALLTEEEVWNLEECASHTYVGYPNILDNVIFNEETGNYEAGHYFQLYVNVLRGNPNARYTIIYAASVSDAEIQEFKNLISDHCGGAALNRVEITRSDQPIITQFAFYDLDIDKLRKRHPVLHQFVSDHIVKQNKLAILLAPQNTADVHFVVQDDFVQYMFDSFGYLLKYSSPV